METVQNVDVSWLHHTNRESPIQKSSSVAQKDIVDRYRSLPDTPPAVPEKPPHILPSKAQTTLMNGNVTSNGERSSHNGHRPHLHLHHTSESKDTGPSPPKFSKDKPPIPPLGRKGSWLSNIKSQFSTSNQQSPSPSPSSAAKSAPTLSISGPSNGSPSTPIASKDGKKGEQAAQTLPSPKSSTPSFLQSALRRLSSSSTTMGKMSTSGGVCARRVLNVDPYRERCQIEGLQPAKLRRVSFCVDVEIAGHATYGQDEEDEPPATPDRRPSLTELERHASNKKTKEQKAKVKEKAEGEALKHPDALASTKIESGSAESIEEKVGQTPNSATASSSAEQLPQTSKKKEKKKRSEEERKQRKEKKRQQALANGSIPLEIRKESSSSESVSPQHASPVRQRDRPTTDPLRIYRRCCQLRETNALKRVTEQLSSPSSSDPSSQGTVTCLDLSGSRMQLPDIITLGDYLGVVPVRRLILEDCDLTDEGLRVILAGLLSVKTPDQAKFNRDLANGKNDELKEKMKRLGVVEKVSLKNNPRIGRDGWRYISLFLAMSRSLKAIDLSMIKFPAKVETTASATQQGATPNKSQASAKTPVDPSAAFERSLLERLPGSRLEELVMAECNLSTGLVRKIVHAVNNTGLTRLGLAGNNLDAEALEAIANFVQTGKCEGLDLGGNALTDELLHILVKSLETPNNKIYALSLADCSLTPQSLKTLLPALAQLPNFRFVDLSHNRRLFSTQPNAISLFRKYLPRLELLKRIHLNDVAMEPEHCIAIAEILPEMSSLTILSIQENPKISALASAKDEASREEACALYASLLAAVRVSNSIVSVEVDVPTSDAGEIVQALAKQVVAYSLRNMERGPIAEITADEARLQDKSVEVPEVLLHIVGHGDVPAEFMDDESAPDDDYIVSGTGVVKALSVCLGNKAVSDNRRASGQASPIASGYTTPKLGPNGTDIKSKAMSKNLLASARKIKARLQPALARESKQGDELAYRRLKSLDWTLERIIQRFEEEYPECRPKATQDSPLTDSGLLETLSATPDPNSATSNPAFKNPFAPDEDLCDEDPEDESTRPIRPASRTMSRHDSDVSIASRYLAQEEGRMLRFGQQVKRDLLRPQTEDHHHGTTGEEVEPMHLQDLREKLEALSGNEIRDRIESVGYEAALEELGADAERLRLLKKEDPDYAEVFEEARRHAAVNVGGVGEEKKGGGGGELKTEEKTRL